MKQWWVHYTHNGNAAKSRVQSHPTNGDEQAIHNGLGFARYCHPNEEIKFVRLEYIGFEPIS